jgi:two-component system, LytTR family, response regulator
MGELKILIAEDDLPSKKLLSYFIQLLPEYKVVGEATTGNELIELVESVRPDIVLVDIHMPGINGVEAAKICKQKHPSLQVIFTTGSDEFAVDAFNLSAVDYIVKPIEKVRLFIALEKAKQSIHLQESKEAKSFYKNKLAIKSNQNYLYLSMDDILYIEKEGRKTILHTENDRFETMESLQDMEERLPGYFYKTHRSYLVNLRKIVKIEASGETYRANFTNPEKIAYISKLKINDVHRLMEA